MSKTIEITDANFKEEVIESGVPVLLDFWAPWCGPCRMVGPIIDEIAEEYEGRLKVGKLNTQDNPEVPQGFGVRSIPTVLLLQGGEVRDAFVGARPKAAFTKTIDRYLKKAEKRHKKEEKKRQKEAAA
jgi:thioredoxin 1